MPNRKLLPIKRLQCTGLLLLGVGCMASMARADERKTLIDFGGETTGVEMGITDDGVMGGLSKGRIQRTADGTALFSGTLSLENNGGFSSLRMEGGKWNLEGWKGIVVKVRGDGRTYDLRLTTDERFRGSPVSFRAPVPTVDGKWATVKVPFTDLKAGWRGRSLDTVFDPAKIEGLGIILGDKKAGPFRMEMKWLKAWK